MNTPDTECPKTLKEELTEQILVVKRMIEAMKPYNDDMFVATVLPNLHIWAHQYVEDIRSSRDTYWKERVEEEVPNALHEYAKWLLENPDAEPLVRRAKKNEIARAITNEDNLK